jgi:hypothetical protein
MRYKASDDKNDIGHICCYSAVVLDTTRCDRHNEFEAICECFDIETAEMIAAALNVAETHKG